MIVFRSLLLWAYIALSLPLWWLGALGIWLLSTPFDRRRGLLHRYSCWWGAHYLHVVPFLRVEVQGREHLDNGAFVLAANHQSLADVLAIFATHVHFKWVSKASVFLVPFLGWNMWMNDYIGLRRGDRDSIRTMMRRASEHLRRGSSVLLFPEGTRSTNGRIHPFKHGAFTLAIDNWVAVAPIVIEGTHDALPKRGLLFRNQATIRIKILPPVHPEEVDGDRDSLRERVRLRIAEVLADVRGVDVDEVLEAV